MTVENGPQNAPNDDIRAKVLHGIRWTASVRLATQVFTWSVTLLVVRFLTKDDYGLNSMATVVVSFVLLFSTGGLQQALVQAKTIRDDQVAKIFGLLLLVNGGLCLAIVAVAHPVALYYEDMRVAPLLRVLASAFLLVPFISVPTGLLSRDMEFKKRSFGELTKATVASVVSLTLAFLGYGVWALVWAQIAGMAAQAIYLAFARPWFRLPRFTTSGIETMFRFGGIVMVTDAVWMMAWRTDVFIGGRILETAVIGLYGLALDLAAIPMQRIMPMLHQIAFPAYARIRDDRAAVGRYYLKSVRLVTLVTVPLLFGIAAVARWGAPVLLGEYWRESWLPIALIALVLPLRAVGTLNSPLLNAIGRTRVNLANALTTLVVLPVGFWVGSRWGVVGLSASWLVTFPIVFGVMSFQMLRLLDLRFSQLARAAAPATVAGVAMLVVVTGVGRLLPEVHDIVALVVLIPIGAAVYLGILWTFHRDRLLETVDLVRRRARA